MEVVDNPLRARPASPLLKRRAGEYASRPRAIPAVKRTGKPLFDGPSSWVAPPPAHPDGEALRPRSCAGPFCVGSAARIPILIICVVSTIRCIAAGTLTGSVRVHAATSRRSRIGGARCCSASCACRSTSATGASTRSAAGATGATTSRSAASAASAATTAAAALCQRGRTDGDCCKQRESEYFSYRHPGLHVGVSFIGNRQHANCSDLGKVRAT